MYIVNVLRHQLIIKELYISFYIIKIKKIPPTKKNTFYFLLFMYFCTRKNQVAMDNNITPPPTVISDYQEIALLRAKHFFTFPLRKKPQEIPKSIREQFVYVFIDTFGMSIDKIAVFFHKHKSTISRDYEMARWKKEKIKGYDGIIYNTRALLMQNARYLPPDKRITRR